ncbi:hypothetical protein AACH06_18800 [Ideonella sp. DXS29W]|uniref:GTPase HflX N-terminal domain-containing protein n=1 Tax=Ideonella lacteola TaxID=2984193 RepID=A0ABU9BSC6_9BURK
MKNREHQNGKRAIIAALVSSKATDTESRIQELQGVLAEKGIDVVAHLVQRRGVSRSKQNGAKRLDSPLTSATIFGRGKVEELAWLVKEKSVSVVYVLNLLSSTQIQRLSDLTGCEVLSHVGAS